ncbi:hypothetical protein JKP88DRAFT_290358 [Tribonema minus]|uniref:Cilia- and flagella-associated protein 69 ARM repeats domain-containing protein n=1 Tax=Tribonema minus TaxID=303371 RepID=A0A836CF99_9STRA|nr:hypothetical protein JKP88DRAFT_290358 [Tribonema minus]
MQGLADAAAASFEHQLQQLIGMCAKPPLCQNAAEASRLSSGDAVVQDIYASLAAMLDLNEAVQVACAGALRTIAKRTCDDAAAAGRRRAAQRDMLLASGAVSAAVAQLAEASEDVLTRALWAARRDGASEDEASEHVLTRVLWAARRDGASEDEESPVNRNGSDECSEEGSLPPPADVLVLHPSRASPAALLALVRLIRQLSKGEQRAQALARLIRQLSKDATMCACMVTEGVVASLVRCLQAGPHLRRGVLQVAIETLWNALEHSQHAIETAAAPSSRSELLLVARKANAAFALSSRESAGRGSYDRALRNEALIVATLVARCRRSHEHLRDTGMLRLLIWFATAVETREPCLAQEGSAHHSHQVCKYGWAYEEDLQYKGLLWSLLADLSREDSEALAAVKASPLLEVLLTYVDMVPEQGSAATSPPPYASPHVPRSIGLATLAQSTEARALGALLLLAPRLSAQFTALGGHVVLMRCLERSAATATVGLGLSTSPVKDASDSATAFNCGLAKGAMMVLAAVAGLPGLQDGLGQLNAVDVMLRRLESEASASMRMACLVCLTKLCSGSPANQDAFREADGASVLAAHLRHYCDRQGRAVAAGKRRQPIAGNIAHSTASICSGSSPCDVAVDSGGGGGAAACASAAEQVEPLVVLAMTCIREAIVGNRRTEARFLQHEGLDALLDLLEVCPPAMRHQAAALAADLLGNKRARAYARAWRSDSGMLTIAQQPAPDVSAPAADALPDDVASLFSATARSSALQRIADRQDLRAKIHTIVQLVLPEGGDGDSTAASAEPQAAALTPEQQQAMHMAINYHRQAQLFRIGDAWLRVLQELADDAVKPIAADAKTLERHIGVCAEQAAEVRRQQLQLHELRLQEARRQEQELFDSILHQRDQEARQAVIKVATSPAGTLKRKIAAKRATAAAAAAPVAAIAM